MSKNPEAHIKKALDSLYNAIQSDYEEKYADWLKNTFKEYEHLNIKNPEEYSLLKSITLDEQAYLLAQEATSHLEIDEKKRHKILFVYLLYDFIERHLEKFIMEHEGVIYSTDKTRWLINTYVEYLVYGKVPVIDREEFWHPMNLEIMDWINWIDSMSELYYGDEKAYIATKEKLVECY